VIAFASSSAIGIACAAPTTDDVQATPQSATVSSPLGFMCECRAKEPGVENAKGIKECSYECTCSTLHPDALRPEGTVTVGPMESEAYSFETWDKGSRICHGQYAFRPTIDAPNWQIQVKFEPFKLAHIGYVSFANPGEPSSRPEVYVTQVLQTSTTVTETIKRTAKAPEVTAALAKRFGVTLPTTR
jgi:hypothetical protein